MKLNLSEHGRAYEVVLELRSESARKANQKLEKLAIFQKCEKCTKCEKFTLFKLLKNGHFSHFFTLSRAIFETLKNDAFPLSERKGVKKRCTATFWESCPATFWKVLFLLRVFGLSAPAGDSQYADSKRSVRFAR